MSTYFKVPDSFEVKLMHFLIFDDSSMQHGQIENKLPFEGDDEEDNTVTYFIPETRFTINMFR